MGFENNCRAAVGAAALILAITLSGCGEKKTGELNPDLRNDARAVERASPPAGADSRRAGTPAPLTSTIRQPLSQAELDNVYRGSEPYSQQRPPDSRGYAPPQARAPESYDEGKVVGEAEWNVQVTREWRHIVVHHSGSGSGSAAEFDKYHRSRGWDGLGYHFVIGNGHGSGDGEIETGFRWRKQMPGAHAGEIEYNQHGIGICLVGDFEHGQQPSPRQMASLRRLVRFLQVQTGVPTCEVVGHNNVPGKHTECPGRNLDLGAFRASLGSGAIGVPVQISGAGVPARQVLSAAGREARPAMNKPRGAGSAALP